MTHLSLNRRCRTAALSICSAALAALTIASASPGLALAGPTVKVRVEGESSTLLALTSVTLEAPEPASGCPANSATAAINLAVGGNWDHGDAEGSKGDFTETVLGETHAFTKEGDTWAAWIDDRWAGGICEDLLSEGDEVLLVADHEPEPTFQPTVLPLVLSAPQSVVAGTPFTLHVQKVHTRPGTFAEIGEGSPQPEAGATVSGAGFSATTGAEGAATLVLSHPATYALIAREPGAAPSAPVSVCVAASGEPACGAGLPASGPGAAVSPGVGSPYQGPFAVVAKAIGLLEGHVYSRRQAPRVLAGQVLAHAPIASVSLRLRREYRKRCFAYSGVRAAFQRARCGQASFFAVSTGASFSYLLPTRLPAGRYVLDIQAADTAGNQTQLARGTTRIVFYVR